MLYATVNDVMEILGKQNRLTLGTDITEAEILAVIEAVSEQIDGKLAGKVPVPLDVIFEPDGSQACFYKSIRRACAYLAAYQIAVEFTIGSQKNDLPAGVLEWKKIGEALIQDFLSSAVFSDSNAVPITTGTGTDFEKLAKSFISLYKEPSYIEEGN